MQLLKLESLLPEQLRTHLHHFCIIEDTLVLFNLLKGNGYPQCGSVGTVGCHGLNDIGYGNNLRFEKDLFVLRDLEGNLNRLIFHGAGGRFRLWDKAIQHLLIYHILIENGP